MSTRLLEEDASSHRGAGGDVHAREGGPLTTTTAEEREREPEGGEGGREAQLLRRLFHLSRVVVGAAGVLVVVLLVGWLGSVSRLGSTRWEAASRLGAGARNRVHRVVSGDVGGGGGGVSIRVGAPATPSLPVTPQSQHFRAPTGSLLHIDANNWAPEPAALGESWGGADQVLPRWAQPGVMRAPGPRGGEFFTLSSLVGLHSPGIILVMWTIPAVID